MASGVRTAILRGERAVAERKLNRVRVLVYLGFVFPPLALGAYAALLVAAVIWGGR
jgi:hypothetical protein